MPAGVVPRRRGAPRCPSGGAAGRLRAVLLAGTPVGASKRYSSVRANATASSTASIGVAQLVTKRATGRPFT